MKYRVLIITAMVLTAACISCTKNNPSQSIRMEINQAMQAQQDAWNRGDVEAFMQYYWNDDSLLFIGLKGPTYGWKTTLVNGRSSAELKRLEVTIRCYGAEKINSGR
jgi:hypothetical protein